MNYLQANRSRVDGGGRRFWKQRFLRDTNWYLNSIIVKHIVVTFVLSTIRSHSDSECIAKHMTPMSLIEMHMSSKSQYGY